MKNKTDYFFERNPCNICFMNRFVSGNAVEAEKIVNRSNGRFLVDVTE